MIIFNDYLFYFLAINTIKNQNGGHLLSIQVLSLINCYSPFLVVKWDRCINEIVIFCAYLVKGE